MEHIRWKEAFVFLDEDNSGAISIDDLHLLIRALGNTPTQQDLQRIDEELTDNEQIDYLWFLNLMCRLSCTKYSYEQIENAFFTFDTNRYGLINVQTFRAAMMSTGEPLSESEMNEMMKDLLVDEDGFIEYESFCAQLQTKDGASIWRTAANEEKN